MPAGLEGTLYRTGPGLLERFGRALSHPFEADGVVSATRFAAGSAQGACRVVESAGYREEEAAGRFLYSSAASFWDRLRAMRRGVAKTTGNTSVLHHQERLYTLMEGGLAQEIDADSLEALEATDFGVVQRAFSAHPHRVAALRTTFNFGLRYGRNMLIDLYAMPDVGPARHLTTLKAPWMSLVHDFVATERHLVLLLSPVRLVLWRAMLGLLDLEKLFRWLPELGTRVFVVPLNDLERPRTFELEPFWVWHFVNAFDDGGGLSVDLCRYEDFASLGEIGDTEGTSLPTLMRLHLDLASGRSVWSRRADGAVEFPQLHPSRHGGRHDVFFAQTRGSEGDGISRIDDGGTLTTWHAPAHQLVSEPVLVPRSEAADDVWVLDLVLDTQSDASHVAVLDGQRLSEGPVARVHFDQPLPLTFHGTFVPR